MKISTVAPRLAASYSFRLDSKRCLVAVFTPTRLTTNGFNGDGKADLLFRNGDGTPVMVLMDGAQAASVTHMAGKPASWSVAGIADLSNDRKADLLWLDADGSVAVLFMNGTSVASSTGLGVVPTIWTIVP